MTKHPILQSGFVAKDDEDLVHYVVKRDPFVDVALNKDHLKPHNPYFYSEEITSLYKEWSAKPDLIKDFDFREKILKFALHKFDKLLLSWLKLQTKSPYAGELHSVFINETVEYVLDIRSRQIHVSQWIRLLDASVKRNNIETKCDKYFDPTQGFTKYLHLNVFTNFISNWVSKSDGYVDLLISLYVIFGARNDITDVIDNYSA